MNCLKSMKSTIKTFDLFCSNEILRVNSDDKYETCTGGVISIIIIIATIIGFSSQILSTIEKSKYQSTLQVIHQNDPPLLQFKTGQENSMMAIGITNQNGTRINLNEGPQLFDILLVQIKLQNGFIKSRKKLNLQACSQKHNWNLQQEKTKLINDDRNKYLCIKNDQKYSIQGKFGSKDRYSIRFLINRCVNTTSNGNKCASPQAINNMFNVSKIYFVALLFTNTVINPNQPNHLSSYLSADNTFKITEGIIPQAQIQISDYQISTDQNILPFQNIWKQKGFISENRASLIYVTRKLNDPYLAGYSISKSSKSLYYTRSAVKITTVISYIGGLIGAFITFLFVLKTYTNISLEICIAQSVFTQDLKKNSINLEPKINSQQPELIVQNNGQNLPQTQKQQINFHIFTFFQLIWFKVMNFFKCNIKNSEKFQKIQAYRQQIVKQLDISTLLRRVLRIQNYLNELIRVKQGQLNNDDKYSMTLQKAKYLRKLVKTISECQIQNQSDIQDLTANNLMKNNIETLQKSNKLQYKGTQQLEQSSKTDKKKSLSKNIIENKCDKINQLIKMDKPQLNQLIVEDFQDCSYQIPVEYINKKSILHSNLRIQIHKKQQQKQQQ